METALWCRPGFARRTAEAAVPTFRLSNSQLFLATRPRDSLPDRGADRGETGARGRRCLAAPWEMVELVRGWRRWRLPRPPREAARTAGWLIPRACAYRGSIPAGDGLRRA